MSLVLYQCDADALDGTGVDASLSKVVDVDIDDVVAVAADPKIWPSLFKQSHQQKRTEAHETSRFLDLVGQCDRLSTDTFCC